MTELPARIAAKICVEGQHWLWTAGTDEKGYAKVWWEGRTRRAHVVIYELLVGPVPEGEELDHVCRIRHCVNPACVEPVEHPENLRRGRHANREKTHCPKGHEYTPENTYVRPDKKGRECRTCRADRIAAWRAAHSA